MARHAQAILCSVVAVGAIAATVFGVVLFESLYSDADSSASVRSQTSLPDEPPPLLPSSASAPATVELFRNEVTEEREPASSLPLEATEHEVDPAEVDGRDRESIADLEALVQLVRDGEQVGHRLRHRLERIPENVARLAIPALLDLFPTDWSLADPDRVCMDASAVWLLIQVAARASDAVLEAEILNPLVDAWKPGRWIENGNRDRYDQRVRGRPDSRPACLAIGPRDAMLAAVLVKNGEARCGMLPALRLAVRAAARGDQEFGLKPLPAEAWVSQILECLASENWLQPGREFIHDLQPRTQAEFHDGLAKAVAVGYTATRGVDEEWSRYCQGLTTLLDRIACSPGSGQAFWSTRLTAQSAVVALSAEGVPRGGGGGGLRYVRSGGAPSDQPPQDLIRSIESMDHDVVEFAFRTSVAIGWPRALALAEEVVSKYVAANSLSRLEAHSAYHAIFANLLRDGAGSWAAEVRLVMLGIIGSRYGSPRADSIPREEGSGDDDSERAPTAISAEELARLAERIGRPASDETRYLRIKHRMVTMVAETDAPGSARLMAVASLLGPQFDRWPDWQGVTLRDHCIQSMESHFGARFAHRRLPEYAELIVALLEGHLRRLPGMGARLERQYNSEQKLISPLRVEDLVQIARLAQGCPIINLSAPSRQMRASLGALRDRPLADFAQEYEAHHVWDKCSTLRLALLLSGWDV